MRCVDTFSTTRSSDSRELIKNLITSIKSAVANPTSNSAPLQALLADVSGQVTEAVSTNDFFKRWGRHYLRSHFLQICSNFKDPGMQEYGGACFSALRDVGDDIFMSMPAPKPSGRDSSGCQAVTMSSANFSRTYYNSGNACFSGDCIVTLAPGKYKLVGQMKKGDVVMTPDGTFATVECVIKTLTENGKCDLVQLDNGLKSTPYHPIRLNGSWVFPKDVKPITKDASCHAVYSFVLENRESSMIINDVECITLAHGITGDPVASHPYFSTEKIIDDLEKFGSSYSRGLVVLDFGAMARIDDGNCDTLVNGIFPERVVV
jgi:hypothetical protein